MNVWNFTGNLGKDAELKTTAKGDPVLNFSVGVKAGYGEKATTTWANCGMYGKRGEAIAQYMTKGALVGCTGEVREYKDKNDQTRYAVTVSDVTLLGGKPQSDKPHQEKPAKQQSSGGGNFNDLDDDIPF